jgi:hypothetical protein
LCIRFSMIIEIRNYLLIIHLKNLNICSKHSFIPFRRLSLVQIFNNLVLVQLDRKLYVKMKLITNEFVQLLHELLHAHVRYQEQASPHVVFLHTNDTPSSSASGSSTSSASGSSTSSASSHDSIDTQTGLYYSNVGIILIFSRTSFKCILVSMSLHSIHHLI